ncbi:phosphate-starvation-inducible PsiE family protein [Thermodesulfatator atlanticus]
MKTTKKKSVLFDFYDRIEIGLYTLLILSLVLAVIFIFFEIFTSWWHYLKEGHPIYFVFFVLDRALLALMLLEILHTIKITLKGSIKLAIEPFLMIGIIASVRRILVLSVEIAHPPEGKVVTETVFKHYMLETALLIVLILSFVAGIIILRRCFSTGTGVK